MIAVGFFVFLRILRFIRLERLFIMNRIKGLAAMLLAVCMIACTAVCVYASNEVVISANGEQTVTAADNLVIDGSECTVNLDNATIGSTGSAVVIKNNSNVTLNLIGESTVTGDSSTESCGIYVEYGSALTIKGSGTLKVTGGKYGAAIGSYGTERNLAVEDRLKCGDVTIAEGTVYAYGGDKGAGIGSGNYNKQTGIVNVVNTPLESLSVNLPLGSTVTADGYKAMVKVTSANVFIETAKDKSICDTNYYWNY